MQVMIQKFPTLEGNVELFDAAGNENLIYDYYQEYNLPNTPGSPMELIFRGYDKAFIPNGPGDVFMDGGIYTIVQFIVGGNVTSNRSG